MLMLMLLPEVSLAQVLGAIFATTMILWLVISAVQYVSHWMMKWNRRRTYG